MRVALFVAGFAMFSLIYCLQPQLPAFCAVFRVSLATSSLSVSLTTGFPTMLILCAGAGSEALGHRGLVAASIGIAAVIDLLCANALNRTMLLVLRAVEGFVLGRRPTVAMTYYRRGGSGLGARPRDGAVCRRHGGPRRDRHLVIRNNHQSPSARKLACAACHLDSRCPASIQRRAGRCGACLPADRCDLSQANGRPPWWH